MKPTQHPQRNNKQRRADPLIGPAWYTRGHDLHGRGAEPGLITVISVKRRLGTLVGRTGPEYDLRKFVNSRGAFVCLWKALGPSGDLVRIDVDSYRFTRSLA